MTSAQVARAAFRLAQMTYEARHKGADVTDADIARLVAEFGGEPVAIALREQAQMMQEEAGTLEAYGAIRTAKGAAK